MVELEIDGKTVEVPEGSMVIQAAHKVDTYIPHFCYHKKLSIAANCRMCLVEVEKMPKAVPACATPVSAGMIVRTNSDKAVKAQQSVMEFLLINHPLDCPICDQGGECQLQDLAVGYGKSQSRYNEEKRVVFHKNVGPLISMEEMTRCIHCTRCVRFGQEVAGVMELGMLGRGEHSEITSFVGKTVDSELSGNMIDLCPVGALTSKPFRYSARTWELSRRKSVSPHDSVGANLVVQVKNNRVMRVLPMENEAINECWISDKDRFSYEALNSAERLTTPMLKQDGKWLETDWQTALEYVAKGFKGIKADHGANAIAALATPHSTIEELYLLKQLAEGVGTPNIDFRLRQSDFSAPVAHGAPWLGMKIADLSNIDTRVCHRLVPASRSSAARRASAAGREERREAHVPARKQRRLADPGCASRGRGAFGVARPARGHRCGGGRSARGRIAGRVRGPRSVGGCQGRGGVAVGGREARRAARQQRGPAPRFRTDSSSGAMDRGQHRRDARLPDGSGQHGRRASRRCIAGRRRTERTRSVRAAAQGLCALQRRTRIRYGEPRSGARRAEAGGNGRRAVGVQARRGLRRRAPADRTVHGNVGHLRQRRRYGAVVQWRRASARRDASGLEGAARAGQRAGPAGLRIRYRRGSSQRGAGRRAI